MNGKAATLAARLLPAIRQRHLTNTLGQVTCTGFGAGHSRGFMEYGLPCMFCKAVV